MIVMKFGGTSLGNSERILQAVGLIEREAGRRPVVVVSAVATVTDVLISLAENSAKNQGDKELSYIIELHQKLLSKLQLPKNLLDILFEELTSLITLTRNEKALDAKRMDVFLAFGERLSAKIVSAVLNQRSLASKDYSAWELGMITDSQYGNAEILKSSYQLLKNSILALDKIPVITGFIGKNENGETTTLGRGGSDYTAAIIGAAVNAELIQIWTDVDGIMTADPVLIPNAKTIPLLAFEEACELAYFGAKVLHPKMILPAMAKDIPVQVLNTAKPDGEGTMIKRIVPQNWPEGYTVGAFSCKKWITVIHMYSPLFYDGNGVLAEIFQIFDQYRTIIDVIATSVVSASFTTANNKYLNQIIEKLNQWGKVEVAVNKAIVCAVGGGMNSAGVAGNLFSKLGSQNIKVEMISQASGGISITFVVDNADAERALAILHEEYIK